MVAAFDEPAGLGSGLSNDEALELQIETAHRAYLAAVSANDIPAARDYFDAMAALIEQRSVTQVERMERERRLR